MKRFSGKAKWMLSTVLAPEAALLFAATRLSISTTIHPALKALADKQSVEWSLTHTIFASMGGLSFRVGFYSTQMSCLRLSLRLILLPMPTKLKYNFRRGD